jgi:hypothetical protein
MAKRFGKMKEGSPAEMRLDKKMGLKEGTKREEAMDKMRGYKKGGMVKKGK